MTPTDVTGSPARPSTPANAMSCGSATEQPPLARSGFQFRLFTGQTARDLRRSSLVAAMLLPGLVQAASLRIDSPSLRTDIAVDGYGYEIDDDLHVYQFSKSMATSFVDIDLVQGTAKLYAESVYPGNPNWSWQSSVSFRSYLSVTNTGSSAVHLPAGAFSFVYDARYTFDPDVPSAPLPPSAGSARLGSSGTFSVNTPTDGSSGGSFMHSFTVDGTDRVTSYFEQETPLGAGSIAMEASLSGIHVTSSSGDLTIEADETLSLGVYLSVGAGLSKYGGIAVTDGAHTAQLYARLPAGITLEEDEPLRWVSIVPEPSTALMTLQGLLLLGTLGAVRTVASSGAWTARVQGRGGREAIR
jgi:hypothetical protein